MGEAELLVGCGINTATSTVFFTHNGFKLKDVVVKLSALPLACVSFGDIVECGDVKLNFGAEPFRYASPALEAGAAPHASADLLS